MPNVVCKAIKQIPALSGNEPDCGRAKLCVRECYRWHKSERNVYVYNFAERPIEPDGRFLQAKDVDDALVVDFGGLDYLAL